MSQHKSIQLALDVAHRHRDALAKVYAASLRQLEFAQGQMDQLEGYCGDTDNRWMQMNDVVRSAELLKHHYRFVERLQQAIHLQSDTIKKLVAACELAHKNLLQAEFRLVGLKQLLTKRQHEQTLKEKRREQIVTDEFASLRYWQQRAETRQGESL